MLSNLFLLFAKLAAFSYGGGYVMIPIMIESLEANGWASTSEIADAVAIAGMSPGPVASNAAVGVGYNIAGLPGVIVAFLGIAIPCAIIVIFAAMFFFKLYKHRYVQGALYGLRAVVTGIILYAAVKLAVGNGIILAASDTLIEQGVTVKLFNTNLFESKSIVIFIITFLALLKTRIHPILLIVGSGIIGVLSF